MGKMLSSLWGRHVHLEVPGKFQVNVLKQALVCVHLDLGGRRAGGEPGVLTYSREAWPVTRAVRAVGEPGQPRQFLSTCNSTMYWTSPNSVLRQPEVLQEPHGGGRDGAGAGAGDILHFRGKDSGPRYLDTTLTTSLR